MKLKPDKPLTSLSTLVDVAVRRTAASGPARLAVAGGQDDVTLSWIKLGADKGLIEPVLVGEKRRIRESLRKLETPVDRWRIIDESDRARATRIAAELILKNEADILLRGNVLVRDFFRTLFEPGLGLRNERKFWSVVSAFEIEGLNRLLILTDCALVIETDLAGKLNLIENACEFAGQLGMKSPKVALLAAAEAVSPGMPVSLEEAVIAKMAERGQFPQGVAVDGPLSLDLALSPEAVKKKRLHSPVAGQADILIVDNINIGNALFKSLITLCGARSASGVIGSPFPIAITSRSETPENVLNTLSLAVMMLQSPG